MLLRLVIVLVLVEISQCHNLMGSLYRNKVAQSNTWKTVYVQQTLDHFTLDKVPQKFSQRLLINIENWKPSSGVLFFYTGNEGDIEMFAQNTGFLFDTAPAFDAAVVFAEHRYYGNSLPFGNESFSDWTKTQYLTVDQAIADYVENVKWLKEVYLNTTDVPAITFGGSYGGMLAAWMRMRYPSVVQGAISASSPVWMFPGMMKDLTGPYRVITNVFRAAAADCPTKVLQSWDLITNLGNTIAGRMKLQQFFHLCDPLSGPDDVIKLVDWLNSMYFDMAMVNYPYPTSFLADLPAWPVTEFCKRASAGNDTVASIAAGTQVYSNYTGKVKCLDLNADPAGGLGMIAWDFQACMELILPISSDPTVDMFPAYEFNLAQEIAYCEKQWNTTARPYWLKYSLGGIDGFDYYSSSQIFFSNGDLDPWSAGGVDIQEEPICQLDCPNVLIKNGAHHLDLRSSNPADPESVLSARKKEVDAIRRWTGKSREEL